MRCVLLLLLLATGACNTVQGAKEDAKSVGRVFTSHPNEPPPPPQ